MTQIIEQGRGPSILPASIDGQQVSTIARVAAKISDGFRTHGRIGGSYQASLFRFLLEGEGVLVQSLASNVESRKTLGILTSILEVVDETDKVSPQVLFAQRLLDAGGSMLGEDLDKSSKTTANKAVSTLGLAARKGFNLESAGIARKHSASIRALAEKGNPDAVFLLEHAFYDEDGMLVGDAASYLLKRVATGEFVPEKTRAFLTTVSTKQVVDFFLPVFAESKDDAKTVDSKDSGVGNTLDLRTCLAFLFDGRDLATEMRKKIKSQLEQASDSEMITMLAFLREVSSSFVSVDYSSVYQGSAKVGRMFRDMEERIAKMKQDSDTGTASGFLSIFYSPHFSEGKTIWNMKIAEARELHGERVADLSKYGLDPEALFSAWVSGDPRTNLVVNANLHMVDVLEAKNPGITAFLQKEHGISHFARYTEPLLVAQYERRMRIQKPDFVVFFASSDWTGMLYSGKRKALQSLQDLIPDREAVIQLEEVAGESEALRKTIRMKSQYGEVPKIYSAVHGSPDTIQFGKHRRGGSITLEGLKKTSSHRAQRFGPGMEIFLHSCQVGESEGVAQELSHKLQARVIAPVVSVSEGVFMRDENGQIIMRYDRQNVGRVYENGELVQKV